MRRPLVQKVKARRKRPRPAGKSIIGYGRKGRAETGQAELGQVLDAKA